MADNHQPDRRVAWLRSWAGLAFAGLAALGLVLLAYGHRMHIPYGNLLGLVPLFACLAMHRLMHGSHHRHGGQHHSHAPANRPAPPETDGQ